MTHHEHCHDDHDHDDNHGGSIRKHLVILIVAMLVNGGYGAFELYLARNEEASTSLLADGLHNASDMLSMLIPALALTAVLLVRPTLTWSYGLRRSSNMAAALNYAILIAFMLWAMYEAYRRFQDPREFSGRTILVVGAIGFAVNLASTTLLHGEKDASHNMGAAYWHQAVDLMSSACVMIAGALNMYMGWTWADPVLTIGVSVLVIGVVTRGALESWGIEFGKTPSSVDGRAIAAYLDNRFGYESYHALTFRGDDFGVEATVHIDVVLEQRHHGELRREILSAMKKHGVSRADIVIEHPVEDCSDRNQRIGTAISRGVGAFAHIGHSH